MCFPFVPRALHVIIQKFESHDSYQIGSVAQVVLTDTHVTFKSPF